MKEILGAPVGQVEFVKAQLEKKSAEHSVLFQRIPLVENLQAASLLLSFCAAARANFIMRIVSPEVGEAFATGLDDSARAQILADDDQPSITHGLFGSPQRCEIQPSRSWGKHRGHGARKASRSRSDPRGEFDARHSRDVSQQCATVPAQIGSCWF